MMSVMIMFWGRCRNKQKKDARRVIAWNQMDTCLPDQRVDGKNKTWITRGTNRALSAVIDPSVD